MATEEVDDFLAHFGIKGMRWGVRKEQEVSAETQAKRNEKAQRYVDKAASLQTRITELQSKRAISKNPYMRARMHADIRKLSVKKKEALDDAERKRQGKLSKKQKNAVQAAAIVAAIVASRVAYNNIQSGEARRKAIKGKDFVLRKSGQGSRWKKSPYLASKDLDEDSIMRVVVNGINPEYGKPGTKMNCRRCTFAYEMRRRGFDVAATRTTNANGQNSAGLMNVLSPGHKTVPTSTRSVIREVTRETERGKTLSMLGGGKDKLDPKDVFAGLMKHPEGARGELGVTWAPGGGHSMAWEVIKGKPVIFDTQNGRRYRSMKDLIDDVGEDVIHSASATRLDNIPLNEDFLLRWVKNAK